MRVWFLDPHSIEKTIAEAYNSYMNLIPDGDSACLRDHDTLLLTPDSGAKITEYANEYPDAVLVCYTNRIHPTAKEQLLTGVPSNNPNILEHIGFAKSLGNKTVTECKGNLSGFLMVVPKLVWNKVKFRGDGLLGVDTNFYKDLREAGIKILRMDNLYVWHTYRLDKEITDKSHLQ